MPFYVHVKDAEPTTGDRYFTRTDALVGFDGRTHKITYVSDDSDFLDWTSRERARFQDGEYIRTPWVDKDAYTLHFAHMSLKQPGMIAFTRDFENGYLDKQTIIKPGKYLTQYYADIFTAEDIARYVAACTSDAVEFKIATSADDIQKVYENGPRSCMAHTFGSRSYRDCRCCQTSDESGTHYTYDSSEHPVRVYGDSDLAVAYYGDINNKVSARAVIWPEKKIYSRVYGATAVLIRLLEAAGYESGEVDGAYVRAIEDRGTYIMPYVDGIAYARPTRRNNRTWIELGSYNRGEMIDCSNTNGLGAEVQDDENTFYCDSCNGTYDDDHYGGDGMCSDCYEQNFTNCAGCNDSFNNDRLTESATGEMYCGRCFRNAAENCTVCGTSFNPLEFNHGQADDRRRNNLDTLCSDCESTHDYCNTCESHYAVDGSDDIHASEPIARVEFAGDGVNVSGIYPADLIPAVDTDNPLRMTCSECDRTYIRCDRTKSLIDEIDRLEGLEQLAIAAEQLRQQQESERQQAEYRAANGIQFVTVYRGTYGYNENRRYRAFEYSHINHGGSWRFPYANDGAELSMTSDLEAIDSAFTRLRSQDREAYGYAPVDAGWIAIPDESLFQHVYAEDIRPESSNLCSVCQTTLTRVVPHGRICQHCASNSAGEDIDAGEAYPLTVYRRSAIVPAEYWRIVHTTPEQRTHAMRETWMYVERVNLIPAEVGR